MLDKIGNLSKFSNFFFSILTSETNVNQRTNSPSSWALCNNGFINIDVFILLFYLFIYDRQIVFCLNNILDHKILLYLDEI